MSNGRDMRYCRFARAVGKRNVCPYKEEERTIMFCIACRATRLASQQDLIIKQNKAVITLLNKIRDLLQEERRDRGLGYRGEERLEEETEAEESANSL